MKNENECVECGLIVCFSCSRCVVPLYWNCDIVHWKKEHPIKCVYTALNFRSEGDYQICNDCGKIYDKQELVIQRRKQ